MLFRKKSEFLILFFILSESMAVCNRKLCPSGPRRASSARAFAPWISGPALDSTAFSAYPAFGKFTNAYSTVFDRTACGGVCLWGKQKMQDTKRKLAF